MDSKIEIKAYIYRLVCLVMNTELVPMDSNLRRRVKPMTSVSSAVT